MRRIAFLLLLIASSATAQFDLPGSGSDDGPAIVTSNNPSAMKPDTVFANLSPAQAFGEVAKTQTELLKKTDAVSSKLSDLPVQMTDNFEKTMSQLNNLNDKFGALGTLIQFASAYGIYVVLFCAALPVTLILLQLLILCHMCRSSSSSRRSYGRRSEPVEFDSL